MAYSWKALGDEDRSLGLHLRDLPLVHSTSLFEDFRELGKSPSSREVSIISTHLYVKDAEQRIIVVYEVGSSE
jgi:hypothetical protein